MRFIFSQRHKARKAAIEADARYLQYAQEARLAGDQVIERWTFIINAALEALDEPERPVSP